MPAAAALPGTGKGGPGHFFYFFLYIFFFCGQIFGYEKSYLSSSQPCGYSSIRLPVAALISIERKYRLRAYFNKTTAFIMRHRVNYSEAQREIITLALARLPLRRSSISRNSFLPGTHLRHLSGKCRSVD